MVAQEELVVRVAMRMEEMLALPPTVGLETANRALGLGRSAGYALAKRDLYPCRVLKLGRAYRVVTADLLRVLGLGRIEAGPARGAAEDLPAAGNPEAA